MTTMKLKTCLIHILNVEELPFHPSVIVFWNLLAVMWNCCVSPFIMQCTYLHL